MTTSHSKIFDDYEVECNDCQHYWDDTCDGVPIAKKRNCTSFIATRTTDIPLQITFVNKKVDRLKIAIAIVGVIDIILGVLLIT